MLINSLWLSDGTMSLKQPQTKSIKLAMTGRQSGPKKAALESH